MDWKIQLSQLAFDKREELAVNRVLNSKWLTMGEETSAFESEFSSYLGCASTGVAVSSATAAWHLILRALDLPVGSEVIVPALTFVSDVNVLIKLGLKPVLADSISLNNFNVSDDSISNLITDNTRAILIVHFAGYPKCLKNLKSICKNKGIYLIEDVAHAPGASVNGAMCGNMADFGFFSFFSNKNLACGEGGFISSGNEKILKKIRSLRSHGMSAATVDRHAGRASSYDVIDVGENYRIDEIRSAIARVQLEKLDYNNNRRKAVVSIYREQFAGSKVLQPFESVDSGVVSSYHIFPIILPVGVNRTMVMEHMKNNRIQTSIHYPSFKTFTVHKKWSKKYSTPVADEISQRELTLPLCPNLNAFDVKYVSMKLLESICE